ncbi:hypothetical protein [Deinococcus sp. QL22]|nr:hypothetical protein [Deinococcus sp. QL22]UQN08194.1 hypothetical protein M1R55_19125 [Deinococcus sp. QL22]
MHTALGPVFVLRVYVVGRFSMPHYGLADLYTDDSNPALMFLTRPA